MWQSPGKEDAADIEWVCFQLLSRVQLFCNPMDCSPPGSSIPGIFLAGMLEWGAISYSRGPSQPRDCSFLFCITCIGTQILYH